MQPNSVTTHTGVFVKTPPLTITILISQTNFIHQPDCDLTFILVLTTNQILNLKLFSTSDGTFSLLLYWFSQVASPGTHRTHSHPTIKGLHEYTVCVLGEYNSFLISWLKLFFFQLRRHGKSIPERHLCRCLVKKSKENYKKLSQIK